MEKDSRDIAWDDLSREARVEVRKTLYRTLSQVAKAMDMRIDDIMAEALPMELGTDYQSNYRRGSIARALLHKSGRACASLFPGRI